MTVPYLVIGSGRLAEHIKHYFFLSKIRFEAWSRRNSAGVNALYEAAEHAERVLVLITDSEIENFIRSQPCLAGKQIIHCSGALNTSLAVGVHPLMTFGLKLYELETYQRIPFVVDEGGPDFKTLFPRLMNPHVTLAAHDKAFYHALCVLGNNFTTILWQKVFTEFKKRFCIQESFLFPILKQTCHNLLERSVNHLTGPLARNDVVTIQKNINALEDDPFQDVYRAFVTAFQKMKAENLVS